MKALLTVLVVLGLAAGASALTVTQITDWSGMTGIDFGDYQANAYGRGPDPLVMADHGLEMTVAYTALDAGGLLWNGKTIDGNPGPSLILCRTDLNMYANPLEFTFSATDGSGDPATVSSFLVMWYYSRYYDVELYDVDGNMIGSPMTFHGQYYDTVGIGWEVTDDLGNPVSAINKIKVFYNDYAGGTSWGGIYGAGLSADDLYYAGYVPEPMTMVLLSLGGVLSLRRRR